MRPVSWLSTCACGGPVAIREGIALRQSVIDISFALDSPFSTALALMKLYNALTKVGLSEEAATAAATEVAEYEGRLATVERKIDVLQTKTNILLVLVGGIGLRLLFL